MPDVSIDTVTLGLMWFVVFLFSTTCHEGAHALVAKLGGDPTASEQVTFSPIPHIRREPFGMVVMPLLSYFIAGWPMGWASTPYDPLWAHRHPHRAARMALAGPAANFLLMAAAGLSIRAGIALHYFQAPARPTLSRMVEALDPGGFGALAAVLLSIVFSLNLLLATFNLLPVPPLDGNAGVTIFMSEDKARSFLDLFRTQGFAMMGIFLAWAVFYRLSTEIFLVALNGLYLGLVRYG